MNTPIIPTVFANDYQSRRLALGFARFNFYGHELDIYTSTASTDHKRSDLRLPIDMVDLYVDPQMSVGHLANCAGIKVFDTALPIGWIRSNFTDDGLPFPIGVWSYDDHPYLGDFVSLTNMLQRIANALILIGLSSLGMPYSAKINGDTDTRANPSPVLYAGDRIKIVTGDNHYQTTDAVIDHITPDDVFARLDGRIRRVTKINDVTNVWGLIAVAQPTVDVGDTVTVNWRGYGTIEAIVNRVGDKPGSGVYASRQFSTVPYLLHWIDGQWQV